MRSQNFEFKLRISNSNPKFAQISSANTELALLNLKLSVEFELKNFELDISANSVSEH